MERRLIKPVIFRFDGQNLFQPKEPKARYFISDSKYGPMLARVPPFGEFYFSIPAVLNGKSIRSRIIVQSVVAIEHSRNFRPSILLNFNNCFFTTESGTNLVLCENEIYVKTKVLVYKLLDKYFTTTSHTENFWYCSDKTLPELGTEEWGKLMINPFHLSLTYFDKETIYWNDLFEHDE